ncbi:MAG: hypothetical protein A2261_03455 [Candidatus Magasanikbacteria bacterium RIFOXYA2_FULL_44_8]|uniref:Uncharacterized protein n=1 Tax=Candidatus Magasanikbacteria bacterium RIFOXYA2_FULL_44_8 TaxID=1798696 RepID=A0A1F6NK15_9BACT|nr:MAG: hypothetical protein A2261_03455 [Candidatus Magasanikbacteria bacterium RIFOXYA2_FULL_44_8]
MNNKASYVSVAAMLSGLTDDELRALTEKPEWLKKFAGDLLADAIANTFVIPLGDAEVDEQFGDAVAKWRKYAATMAYTGPVAWQVKEGFTLKTHASKAGPTCENLNYLQNWNLKNDEPTQESVVFWVPRLAEKSLGKSVSEMEKLRAELRQAHNLPVAHCDRFGSVALLFALILAHFKRTGERVPLKSLCVASDTLRADGHRLYAGGFDEAGLRCDDWWSDHGSADVGFFLLGVEALGQ